MSGGAGAKGSEPPGDREKIGTDHSARSVGPSVGRVGIDVTPNMPRPPHESHLPLSENATATAINNRSPFLLCHPRARASTTSQLPHALFTQQSQFECLYTLILTVIRYLRFSDRPLVITRTAVVCLFT